MLRPRQTQFASLMGSRHSLEALQAALDVLRMARAARDVREVDGIGFIVESRDRVNQINQRLRDDGIETGAPAHQHGAWTFYFTAPGGFTIEVMA